MNNLILFLFSVSQHSFCRVYVFIMFVIDLFHFYFT